MQYSVGVQKQVTCNKSILLCHNRITFLHNVHFCLTLEHILMFEEYLTSIISNMHIVIYESSCDYKTLKSYLKFS